MQKETFVEKLERQYREAVGRVVEACVHAGICTRRELEGSRRYHRQKLVGKDRGPDTPQLGQ